jgi:hypothetical protein
LVPRVRQVCVRGKVGQRSVPLLLHVSQQYSYCHMLLVG